MENKIDNKKFGTNAIISKENLGFLFVTPYLQVSRYGEFIIATNNTCATYDAVNGGSNNNNFYIEFTIAVDKIKKEIDKFNPKDNENLEAKRRLIAFYDSLKKFMEHFKDGKALTQIIFPSHENNDNILFDLINCLPYKFKGFAFSFSGNEDDDRNNLIKDKQKMNVADLCGLGKIDFKNGSNLISWLPTGTKLVRFISSLKLLLKNVGYSFTNDEEYYGVYIIQSLMNVIFANNGYLPLSETNKIVNNYMQFVNGVFAKQRDLFQELEDILKESEKNKDENNKTENKDFYFVKFLFKKICVGTSLEKIDLNTEDNKTKYFDPVIGVCGILRGADHANQVLVLQKQSSDSTFGDGVILKNNNLYVPFYEILKRLSQSEKFRGADNKFYVNKNSDESKALRQNLTFMINLAGKLRHTETEFDLSKTESQKKYKFGCQQDANGNYLNPINYDTDIDAQKLIDLTKQIIKFEKDVKENKINLETLVKYLLDGRFFGCIPGFDSECIKKIIENKDLMNEFFEGANTGKRGHRCCKAYKIFVNEYFDFITDSKFINQEYLEDENLAKFFLRPENNKKIMELEPEKILKLNLISKLDVDVLNEFLSGSDEDKRKINDILKLCVNHLESEKLSKLDFSKLDSEIIEAIILFKDKILSKDIVKNIDFQPLSLEAQVKLFNWMAKDGFDSFHAGHLRQINSDVFTNQSISVGVLYRFCSILKLGEKGENKFEKFDRRDILQKLPVDLLLLYDRIFERNNQHASFIDFLEQQIGDNKICSQLSNNQILSIGSFFTKSSRLDNFESEKYRFTQLDTEIINNNVSETVYNLADRFYSRLNVNADIRDVTYSLLLWLRKITDKNNPSIGEVIKYIFDNHKNLRLYAFTILEFIMSDEIPMKQQERKSDWESIKQTIKKALDWDKPESRKKIIENCFSCLDDINRFINCIDIYCTNNKCKNSLISTYRSFLNNLVAKYSDDLEKNHVQQIPFYYLEKENVELICTKYPREVNERNFFALTKKFNSIGELRYKTFVDILSKFGAVAEAYKKNESDNKQIFNKIDADYISCIEINMNKIRNGYWVDDNLVCETIKKDLKKYDVSQAKLTNQSPLYYIFKSLIDGNISIEKFIGKYDKDLNKNKLEAILKNKNYDEFEKIFLPVIQKDWAEKDFKTFAKKYNLLKHIANDDTHAEKIVDLYVDFREKKLSEQEFIAKHCLDYEWLKNEEKNQICKALENINDKKISLLDNSNDSTKYTDKDKRHFVCCELMQSFDHVKNNDVKKEIVGFLMNNIKLINNDVDVIISDDSWKKFVQNNLDDENESKVKDYLTEIKCFVSRFELISSCVIPEYKQTSNNNHWIEKVLFGGSDDKAINKLRQLSVIYDDYQKSKKESNWIDFSEVHVLKYISESRIQKYILNKKLDEQYEISEAENNNLKALLVKFCNGLNMQYDKNHKTNKLQFVFNKLKESKNKEVALQLENFLKFVYENKIFSDQQIKNTGIINLYNSMNGNEETPGFIIKYLPLILDCNKSIKNGLNDKEETIIKNLYLIAKDKDKSYPENILCENIKDNKMLAQIMEKISFSQAKDIDSDNYKNGFLWDGVPVNTSNKQQIGFRKFLRTQLLSLLGYQINGKIKTGENDNKGTLMEYYKMTGDIQNKEDIYGFILADFSFVSLVHSCDKSKRDENFDITCKLENLVTNIRNRLKAILNYVDAKDDKQLKDILSKIINKNTFDLDLNELIAREFLRLESHDRLPIQLLSDDNATILYEKIISMLARCSSVEEFRNKTFNDLAEIKNWIQNSSLRYFVPLRLWCTGDSQPSYNTFCNKIFMYILDKRGTVKIVDILKSLYDPDLYQNERIYQCKVDTNTFEGILMRLFDELVQETSEYSIASDMQTIAKFVQKLLFYNINKETFGETLDCVTQSIINCFKKANMFDADNRFKDCNSIRTGITCVVQLSFFDSDHFNTLLGELINFDRILLKDFINALYELLFDQKKLCFKYDLCELADTIYTHIEQTHKTMNNHDIQQIIRFFCDTNFIYSEDVCKKCFLLFDKIIENIKTEENINDNQLKANDWKTKIDCINSVLSNVEVNEKYKAYLNGLKNKYIVKQISGINSIDELKQFLWFIKQNNGNKFPSTSWYDKNNEINNDKEILENVLMKLERLSDSSENNIWDHNDFYLILDFFCSFEFGQYTEDRVTSWSTITVNAIVNELPTEFNDIEQFKKYTGAIQKAFLGNENYPEVYFKILSQLINKSKTLPVFERLKFMNESKSFVIYYNEYTKQSWSDRRREWNDFVMQWANQINTWLNSNQQQMNREDMFTVLVDSVILQSGLDMVLDTQDCTKFTPFLQCLSNIKNIGPINNAKDLEKYFNEIWEPILKSNHWQQIRKYSSEQDYLKSNAGTFRKILIEFILTQKDHENKPVNQISLLEVLKFAVEKFPVDKEQNDKDKIEIRYDVSQSIFDLKDKSDKKLAKDAFDCLDLFFLSNKLSGNFNQKTLMSDLYMRMVEIPKIKSSDDIDNFLDVLNTDIYKKYQLLTGKLLIQIYNSKAEGVTISQMLYYMNKCKLKDTIWKHSDLVFLQHLLNDLEKNKYTLGKGANRENDLKILRRVLLEAYDHYRIGERDQYYQLSKQFIRYLDDECINDYDSFMSIASCICPEQCEININNSYSLDDMKLLRQKTDPHFIQTRFSDIVKRTSESICCTVYKPCDDKPKLSDFFGLLMDGFVSSRIDSRLNNNWALTLILNLDYKNYTHQEYVDEFASVLCKRPKENFEIYRKQFWDNLVYMIKYAPQNNAGISWFANMYILTRLFQSPDLLDEQNIDSVISAICNSQKTAQSIYTPYLVDTNDEMSPCIKEKIKNACITAIKIFLMTQLKKNQTKNMNWIKQIAKKFGIQLPLQEPKKSENQIKRIAQEFDNNKHDNKNLESTNKNIFIGQQNNNNTNQNEGKKSKLIEDEEISSNNSHDTSTSNQEIQKEQQRKSLPQKTNQPSRWLFYLMLTLAIIALVILVLTAIKFMWIPFSIAGFIFIVTVIFAYINRPFCRGKRDRKISLSVNPEEITNDKDEENRNNKMEFNNRFPNSVTEDELLNK